MKTLTTLSNIILLICFLVSPLMGQQSDEHRIALLDGELFGLDRSHSILKFSTEVFGMVETEGTFDDYTATILYNEEDITKTEVIVRIQAESIDTGSNFRDKDLNSERFLYTEKYLEIVFRSTSVDVAPDGYLLHGDLTIKGITKRVSIPFQHILNRTADTIWENIRIGFSGKTTINRYDFNVHGGKDSWGPAVLSEEVDVEFTLLGTNRNLEKIAYSSREKPSIGQEMEKALTENGVAAAIERYRNLKDSNREKYNFGERELNLFVNKLYQRKEYESALQAGELYVQEYPESSHSWTIYGEIHAGLDNKTEAVNAFEKAVELDKKNDWAVLALKRLNGES